MSPGRRPERRSARPRGTDPGDRAVGGEASPPPAARGTTRVARAAWFRRATRPARAASESLTIVVGGSSSRSGSTTSWEQNVGVASRGQWGSSGRDLIVNGGDLFSSTSVANLPRSMTAERAERPLGILDMALRGRIGPLYADVRRLAPPIGQPRWHVAVDQRGLFAASPVAVCGRAGDVPALIRHDPALRLEVLVEPPEARARAPPGQAGFDVCGTRRIGHRAAGQRRWRDSFRGGIGRHPVTAGSPQARA